MSDATNQLEIVGVLEHAAEWKQPKRLPTLTVLQVAGSKVRISTDRLAALDVQQRMAKSTIFIKAIVALPLSNSNDPSPIMSARALWMDGKEVLALERDESERQFTIRAAQIVLIPVATYLLLLAYARWRTKIEA